MLGGSEKMAEERFGRLVLRNDAAAVSVLDLFETPHLLCRGLHMVDGPTDSLAPSVPREVELVIEEAVLGEIENSWTERIVRGGEGSQGVQMAAERLQLNMDMQMNHVVRDAEEGRDLWTGRVSGSHQGNTGRFDFMLERTGSPNLSPYSRPYGLYSSLGVAYIKRWETVLEEPSKSAALEGSNLLRTGGS
jgi:hypothetical protein